MTASSGQPPSPGPEDPSSQGDALPVPETSTVAAAPRLIELPPLRMPPEIPELLHLGGPEAFEDYCEAFARVFLRGAPLVDPQGRIIVFNDNACEHICYHEDRLDRSRRRAEGEGRSREFWDQERAEHILWLLPALTRPSLIVRNNQVRGNLAYLLGFPTGDCNRPNRRYYVSVKPCNKAMTRVEFKTAFPIDQRQWDNAKRDSHRWYGRENIVYRGKTTRW